MASQGDTAGSLRLGDFEIDPASRTLRNQGRPVPLGARALDLLWALVAARGELVTKDELLRRAWPGLVVEEANVQVQVSALRKVLGAEAIATVPSLGYRLALPVTEAGVRPVAHNLWTERTAFIGRAAALVDARSRLADGVLLTLIGIGGSGKTRLARRLAELELDRFADGVWWIDLAPLDRAEQLVPAVAQAVGCALNGKSAPVEALARALRPRQTLLVLDNCEHLVDAACAMLDVLLDSAPGLRVLATSREALGLRGEMILPVKPLDTPRPDATPAQVWSSEAARLFLQAAALACPHWSFGDDTAPAVASICRQLDGIPLALELAASQLQVLGPEQLLAVLQEHFRLTLGARRLLPRQQTLRAVIAWSVDSVGVEEREVLSALTVCAGGCDLEAVQALVGSSLRSDAQIASLARLADCSLITVRHGAGAARYHLLETVRQYVLETLAREKDTAGLQDRHRDHYLQLAETLRAKLALAGRASALAQLDLERENLARAIDWSVSQRQWIAGARLVHALLPYWTARAWLAPGLHLAEAVLAVAQAGENRAQVSALMIDTAHLAQGMGRLEVAGSLASEARRQAQLAGSLKLEIRALVMSAFCIRDGAADALVADLESVLERARQSGLTAEETRVASALAQAHMEKGDFEAARPTLERARSGYEAMGDSLGAVMETIHLAWVAVRIGDAAAARRQLEALARRQPQLDHHPYACLTLSIIGSLAALEQQWARCLRAHLAALRHFEAGGVADAERALREREIARSRESLDAAEQARAEWEAATGSLGADLAWGFEGLRA